MQIKSAAAEDARLYGAFKEWTHKHQVMLKLAAQYALIPSANNLQEQVLLLESRIFRVVISGMQAKAVQNQFEVKMAIVEPISHLQALYASRAEDYDKLMQRKNELMGEVNPATKQKEYAWVMFVVVEYCCSAETQAPSLADLLPSAIKPSIVENHKKQTFDGDFSRCLHAEIDGRSRIYSDGSNMLIVRNALGTSKSLETKKTSRNRRSKKFESSTSGPSHIK
ncbi:hypothetical protein FS837_006371 [Tulasnella sp. UAMH 9824]|nr:hypothetical protein FS837_006371 [Tulasnella sp. UAMH 9824]